MITLAVSAAAAGEVIPAPAMPDTVEMDSCVKVVGDSPQQPKLHLQLYKHLLIKY